MVVYGLVIMVHSAGGCTGSALLRSDILTQEGREALLEQLVAKEIDDNEAYLLFFRFSEAARDKKALVLPVLSRCCAPFKEAQIRSTTLVKYAFAS